MSREKKYTPGPWKIAEEECHIGDICTCHGDDEERKWYGIWTENWSDGVSQIANAHIISAAPDLLEALERLLLLCELEPMEDSALEFDAAEKAIAKAYGVHHE